MSVRLVSLAVLALAAFFAFGDLLIAYSNSSPQTFLTEIGRSIENAVTGVAAWFGIG